MVTFLVIWFFAFPSAVAAWPHKKLDTRHCFLRPSEDPDRAHDFSARQLECWPRDGCWIDRAGNAMCWRTAKLKR